MKYFLIVMFLTLFTACAGTLSDARRAKQNSRHPDPPESTKRAEIQSCIDLDPTDAGIDECLKKFGEK